MKRILHLSLLLFTTFSLSGFAQVMDIGFQKFYDDFEHLKRFNETPEATYKGSPYLNDEFKTGKILLTDGQAYENVLLRYNVYYDNFEFSKEDKALAIDKDPRFSCFLIGERVFKLETFEFDGSTVKGYLEQLIEGDYSLYLKHKTILRDGEESGAYQQATKPAFFIQKPACLIGKKGGPIVEVRNSKDLLNTFGEIEGSIAEFRGKKKIKLKSTTDFKDLVEYLNSGGN